MSMQPSYRQMLIEQQLQPSIVYLHKSTGVRYVIRHTRGEEHLLEPISGACLRATGEQLANAEVWTRLP